jgi:hypothetical protein
VYFRRRPPLVERRQKMKAMIRNHLNRLTLSDLEQNTVCFRIIPSTWPTVTMRSCEGRLEPQTACSQCFSRSSGNPHAFVLMLTCALLSYCFVYLILDCRNHYGSADLGRLVVRQRVCIPGPSRRHKQLQEDVTDLFWLEDKTLFII